MCAKTSYVQNQIEFKQKEKKAITCVFTEAATMFGKGVKYFDCVDLHCEGEPARIVVGGFPTVPGKSMAQKREFIIQNLNHIPKLLLQEPRGYPCQNLNVLFPSQLEGVDWGFVTCEQNSIFPLFSGHNTMCVVTALLETGRVEMVEPETSFDLESPGGIISVVAHCKNGKATKITLQSMPSFVAYTGKKVIVDGFPDGVTVDCAFGGMWYAIVDADEIGLKIVASEGGHIGRIGEKIKIASREQFPVAHPDNLSYTGPDILAFTSGQKELVGEDGEKIIFGRNTVVMSSGQSSNSAILDRSPCGSGTAAIMANLWGKGKLKIGQKFIHESILDTKFEGKLVGEGPRMGPPFDVPSFIPQISGQAFITGYNKIVVHPEDPIQNGYTVGDIWAS